MKWIYLHMHMYRPSLFPILFKKKPLLLLFLALFLQNHTQVCSSSRPSQKLIISIPISIHMGGSKQSKRLLQAAQKVKKPNEILAFLCLMPCLFFCVLLLPCFKNLGWICTQISEREEIIEKKIKAIEVHLLGYGDQIRKSPSDALKAHALLLLKQKRRY